MSDVGEDLASERARHDAAFDDAYDRLCEAVCDPQRRLPRDTMHLLELIAEAGILGGTAEEVAAYLVTRELDDMLRSGCVKFDQAAFAMDAG